MYVEITLAIEPASINEGATTASTVARLTELGGRMVPPEASSDTSPAVATFAFRNPVRRDQFLVEALASPGVSLVTLDRSCPLRPVNAAGAARN